jgi:hypothetical protein
MAHSLPSLSPPGPVKEKYDSPSHLVATLYVCVYRIRSFWHVTGVTHRLNWLITLVLVITKNANDGAVASRFVLILRLFLAGRGHETVREKR